MIDSVHSYQLGNKNQRNDLSTKILSDGLLKVISFEDQKSICLILSHNILHSELKFGLNFQDVKEINSKKILRTCVCSRCTYNERVTSVRSYASAVVQNYEVRVTYRVSYIKACL